MKKVKVEEARYCSSQTFEAQIPPIWYHNKREPKKTNLEFKLNKVKANNKIIIPHCL